MSASLRSRERSTTVLGTLAVAPRDSRAVLACCSFPSCAHLCTMSSPTTRARIRIRRTPSLGGIDRAVSGRHVGLGLGAVVGVGAVAGYAAQRRLARRWRVEKAVVAGAGLVLGDDLTHHDIPVSDGGSIHVVETGDMGPPVVLLHGVTLSVLTWARQIASLSDAHRVVAIDQRGHGRSVAGQDGYEFDRLADDVVEVLEALDVRGAVLVGHSMGGMVALTAASAMSDRLSRHVAGLVLVATSAGPLTGVLLPTVVTSGVVALAERRLTGLDRRGRSIVPGQSMMAWTTRAAFGTRPDPADLELTRGMITATSPATLGGLFASFAGYDVRGRLGEIGLPTRVVVGTRDLLTPAFHARRIARGIRHATLDVLDGCGHMVMLERPDALTAVVRECSAAVTAGAGIR